MPNETAEMATESYSLTDDAYLATESQADSEMSGAALATMLVLLVPAIWIGFALGVKRWHDRDKSGWWILIGMIPIVGPIWTFVECGCLRGTVGPNNYGQDPT